MDPQPWGPNWTPITPQSGVLIPRQFTPHRARRRFLRHYTALLPSVGLKRMTMKLSSWRRVEWRFQVRAAAYGADQR